MAQPLNMTLLGDRRRLWLAVTSAFLGNALLFGTWISRLPAIKDTFTLSHDDLGLLLFLLAGGALIGFPLAGRLCTQFGGLFVTRLFWALLGLAMLALALAPSVLILGGTILVFGIITGAMDVAMNVWATEAETTSRKIWLPSFHAMWSLGTALGALMAILLVPLGWTHSLHFTLAALAVLPLGFWGMGIAWQVKPDSPQKTPIIPPMRGKLLLVGIMTLCATLSEGAVADWSALFLIEVYDLTQSSAPLGFAVFSAAMVIMRLSGALVIKAAGPLGAGATSSALAILGAGLMLWSTSLMATLVGFALMGLGYALVVPLAMARAAASASMPAATAVAGVSTFAYGGMLLGPPVIGFIAEASSLHFALGLLVLMGLFMAATTHALRPPRQG